MAFGYIYIYIYIYIYMCVCVCVCFVVFQPGMVQFRIFRTGTGYAGGVQGFGFSALET